MRGVTIWEVEAIRHDGDRSRGRIQSVHLVREAGCRTEVLEVPIESVGEVDIAVAWIDSYIVKRVELSAKVIVQKD